MKFEELKGKALETAQFAVQKTKDAAAIAKAKLSIAGENETIRKAQQELGKLYYRDFILNEEMDSAEYLPWCDKITAARENVEALKAQIEEIKECGYVADCDFEETEEDIPVAEASDFEQPEQP